MMSGSSKGASHAARFGGQVLAFALLAAGAGYAQAPPGAGQVVTPGSSIEEPGDTGVRAHTNIQIFIPNQGPASGQSPPGDASPGAASSPTQQPRGADGAAPPAQPN
jgi:hypothetical protein